MRLSYSQRICTAVSYLNIAASLAAFIFLPLCALAEPERDRPNFLIIIADDITWSDFGFTGNKDVTTPNLDQLASEGMQLTHVFSSSPVCSPARHALYTGLYPVRNGAYPNHSRLYDGTRTVFTYLKEAGYRVGLQGKSHVAPPSAFAYEHFDKGVKDQFADTRAFIGGATRPWLLVFASADAHRPWNRSHGELPDVDRLTVPGYMHDNAETREQLRAYYGEINKLDWQVGQLLLLLKELQQDRNTVILFISEQGSDFPYGGKWSLYDTGVRAVAVARYPEMIPAGSSSSALIQYVDFVPTILTLAGIDPAAIDTGNVDTLGSTQFDGTQFLPVLKREQDSHRNFVFAQMTTVGIAGFAQSYPMRAVRDKRYKYIRNLQPENQFVIKGIHRSSLLTSWRKDAEHNSSLATRIDKLYRRPFEELYDLENDKYEKINLASDPVFAEKMELLGKQLDHWMQQQGDKGIETELDALSRLSQKRRARLRKLGELAN